MNEKSKSIDKRDAILKTSLRLFTTQGFHATPTAQIAKEAGIATGTLFHYFKSKDDLINTLYLESRRAFVESLGRGMEPGMSLRDKAKRYFMNSLRWGMENLEMFLFYQQYANSPYIDSFTKQRGQQEIKFLLEFIEDGKTQGAFKDMPTDLALAVIESLKIGMIHYFREHRERLDDPAYTDAAFITVWDSIAK